MLLGLLELAIPLPSGDWSYRHVWAFARAVGTQVGSALLAALALAVASLALKYLDLDATARILVALLPVPAYVWFLLAQVEAARHLDELWQRIQLEALVIAFPSTFMGILVTWLLYRAGPLADLTFSDAVASFLLMMILFYLAGLLLAARRYQ
jgi:uncharacterized protein YacL